ncbi:MAG: phage tail assembly chaperone [Alphaproteobacteria bacterium]|nr:phage tail assembly chaperone [Alphaproteobacteria bacterium]
MRSQTDATPWAPWLRAALAMGLAPPVFWRISLKEWRMLTLAEPRFARADLDALAARYPDTQE